MIRDYSFTNHCEWAIQPPPTLKPGLSLVLSPFLLLSP